MLWSNFTFATSHNPLMNAIAIAVLLACVIALARLTSTLYRERTGVSERMITALLIMFAGSIPFLSSNFDSMFIELGDRANQTAAIGAAMVWVGALTMVKRNWILPAGGAALLAIAVPIHFHATLLRIRGRHDDS